MTHRREPDSGRTLTGVVIVSILSLGATSLAFGQSGAVREDVRALSAKPAGSGNSWRDKFAGSGVDLNTYVGSGTFYTGGYRDPYVSTALMLRPTYKLGTKYELSLNARVYLEEEYTAPANPEARHFTPLDTWVWLAARNLYTHPSSKVRIGGQFRGVIPTSYESRYQNTLTILTAGVSAARPFEFGRADKDGKRWELALAVGTAFSKNLQTSIYRGDGGGDSTGCRGPGTLGGVAGGGGGGLVASSSDRCGGPINTNFSFTTSATASLSRGPYSLSSTLIVINQVRYALDDDVLRSMNASTRGRSDLTWGIIAVGYKLTKHLGASLGVSSYQPALDSRYRYPRFPFFDFSGTNANNFTQVFVGVNGTL